MKIYGDYAELDWSVKLGAEPTRQAGASDGAVK